MIGKIKLREKDINKLSTILQISIESLKKMEDMNLLDSAESRNVLIINDWRILKRKKKYKTFQIVEALAGEYKVSASKIETLIYAKKQTKYYCKQCQKRISKGEFKRNDGICDQCVIKSIEI